MPTFSDIGLWLARPVLLVRRPAVVVGLALAALLVVVLAVDPAAGRVNYKY